MRTYDTVDDTLTEWSNALRLRKCQTVEETLNIWSKMLTERYGKHFLVKETATKTLEEWSKLL